MSSILNELIESINNSQLNIKAYEGYEDKPAQRPVMSTAVYFSVEKLSGTQAEFAADVYTPLDLGGSGCIQKAAEICDVISSSVDIKSLVVYSVKYDKCSYGFTCKIKGTADCAALDMTSLGGVYLRAKEFSLSPNFYLNFTAQSVKVRCDNGLYPIFVMYESEAQDDVNTCRKYKAEMKGVSVGAAEMLIQRGRFSLHVFSRAAKPISLTNCCCECCVFESADSADITITGVG